MLTLRKHYNLHSSSKYCCQFAQLVVMLWKREWAFWTRERHKHRVWFTISISIILSNHQANLLCYCTLSMCYCRRGGCSVSPGCRRPSWGPRSGSSPGRWRPGRSCSCRSPPAPHRPSRPHPPSCRWTPGITRKLYFTWIDLCKTQSGRLRSGLAVSDICEFTNLKTTHLFFWLTSKWPKSFFKS